MTTRSNNAVRVAACWPWWLSPQRLALFFVLPCLWGLYVVAPDILRENAFRDYFTFESAVLMSGLVVIYACGAWIGPKVFSRRFHGDGISFVWYDVFFILTIFGYAIWFLPLFGNVSLLFDIVRGQIGAVYDAEELLATTPGVTTFTQAGIALTALLGCDLMEGRNPYRRAKVYAFIVCTLGLLRAIVHSERLALIEVIIPLAPYWVTRVKATRLRKILLAGGPYFGIVILLMFFGSTEYFRSWINYYSASRSSFVEFIVNRVAIYYVYAINTGLGMLHELKAGWTFPVYSFAWLARAPFVSQLVGVDVNHAVRVFLGSYGVPQFNNVSGLTGYVWDYGWVGAGTLLLLNGIAAGCGWRSFQTGRGCLRYVYPVFYIGLLDLIREPYLGQGRSFIPIVLLIIAFAASGRSRRGRASRESGTIDRPDMRTCP